MDECCVVAIQKQQHAHPSTRQTGLNYITGRLNFHLATINPDPAVRGMLAKPPRVMPSPTVYSPQTMNQHADKYRTYARNMLPDACAGLVAVTVLH